MTASTSRSSDIFDIPRYVAVVVFIGRTSCSGDIFDLRRYASISL